jgi:hypothetical protein
MKASRAGYFMIWVPGPLELTGLMGSMWLLGSPTGDGQGR